MKKVRCRYERLYLCFVYVPSIILVLGVIALAFVDMSFFAIALGTFAFFYVIGWIAWKLVVALLVGNSIRVGADQYPQIHRLVLQTSEISAYSKPPTVLILQGEGLFEVLVARRFSRRGLLIITSNALDDLIENRSSRELMFYIGRQLGLIATGYFNPWGIKHTIGQFSFLFYFAWKRRCHMTADRLGLLVAGDLTAAERALVIITAGSGIAPGTNLQAIKEQRNDLFSSFWAWIQLGLSSYPYMVDRIVRVREFAYEAAKRGIRVKLPSWNWSASTLPSVNTCSASHDRPRTRRTGPQRS